MSLVCETNFVSSLYTVSLWSEAWVSSREAHLWFTRSQPSPGAKNTVVVLQVCAPDPSRPLTPLPGWPYLKLDQFKRLVMSLHDSKPTAV